MNEVLEQIVGTVERVQRAKTVANLIVFSGGGAFGVLCFTAGYLVK